VDTTTDEAEEEEAEIEEEGEEAAREVGLKAGDPGKEPLRDSRLFCIKLPGGCKLANESE